MKSKATTYLLIVVVAVVWGIIAWKIFSREPDIDLPNATGAVTKSPVKDTADTLLLNYRDPFLGKSAVAEVAVMAKPRVAKKPEATMKPPPPDIKYIGRISRNGVQHCLLEKDGILNILKINETVGGYRLTAIYTDSVRLQNKDTKLMIHRVH